MLLQQTNRNFDQLAEEVAKSFLTNSEPIKDAVIRIAKRENLNPEETRRLVEKSNTVTTVKMMESTDNKKAEIALADSSDVISQVEPETLSPVEKQASVMPLELPDTRTMKKIASVTFEKLASETPAKKESLIQKRAALKGNVEVLMLGKVALEKELNDDIGALVSKFMRWDKDLNKFASEAYSRASKSGIIG